MINGRGEKQKQSYEHKEYIYFHFLHHLINCNIGHILVKSQQSSCQKPKEHNNNNTGKDYSRNINKNSDLFSRKKVVTDDNVV